jgi:hypothetical protein
MNLFTIIILILSAFSLLSANEVESLAEAKDMAVKLHKPILIDFWSDN